MIAFAAALLAYRYDWFETPFAIVSAFLYTIPSLAFFQLWCRSPGSRGTSAEIALVSYTLLILFRNTLTGLREVPADALEAAQAWASPAARSCGASSCRWRCRRSWPASGSRP